MWGIKVSLTIHIETDRLLNPNREAGNKKKSKGLETRSIIEY